MRSVGAVDLASIRPLPRRSEYQYRDPLDEIWIRGIERMGLKVVRTDSAYAHYDGRGTLAIGTSRILDPDDCLAQIIFHEICHWLVEGEGSFHKENWGLCNQTLRDLDRENASLRVQASLAAPLGLRWFLANTTDHRAYYDALPDDPLAQDDDRTVGLARIGLARSTQSPWAPALQRALEATATIVAAVAPSAAPPSLYTRLEAPRPSRDGGREVRASGAGDDRAPGARTP